MQVFIPHGKDKNIYLDEIIAHSKCEFIFGNFKEYNESYDIVNIQFPEAIFDWRMPNQDELKDLEASLSKWKQHSRVVYTLNDLSKHYDVKNEYVALFELIRKYADGVIHLGNFSLQHYRNLFSTISKHTVIYHPLYDSLLKENNIQNIQEIYPIELNGKYIISVIGGIRSKEEVKLLSKIFKKIPYNNKFLIVPRMYDFIKVPSLIPYRFNKIYKKILIKIFNLQFEKGKYFFSKGFLEYSYIIDLLQKTNLMVVPRVNNLNSGNLYLGLTFDKKMLVPNIGNITEVAIEFNIPMFDVESNDISSKNLFKDVSIQTNYGNSKSKFHPQTIALEYDNFFQIVQAI